MRSLDKTISMSLLILSMTSIAPPSFAGDSRKVPITIGSEDARGAFLKGRDLAERLRAQESIEYFRKAAALDPHCAVAELNLALVVPTAKERFEHMAKAVALAPGASEGEKLQIVAADAGMNGDPERQETSLDELARKFPGDERVQTAVGIFYFGQQAYEKAIDIFKHAIEINPQYSPPYNQLGYAYRFQEKYEEAEKAFRKYAELIPNDPNPYDSYGELLMKMGKFEESIGAYRKALSIDPLFASAMRGVAWNLMYQGKNEQAKSEVKTSLEKARDSGEQRNALFALALIAMDEGNLDEALQWMKAEDAIAQKNSDAASMAADYAVMGAILREAGRHDEALATFKTSLEFIEHSSLDEAVKAAARTAYHYNAASVFLAGKDIAAAKEQCQLFRAGTEALKNPFQTRRAHELAGMVALAEGQWQKAIDELQSANQQDPYNLFRIGEAFKGMGKNVKAREYFLAAGNHHTLPIPAYAFVRHRALAMASGL